MMLNMKLKPIFLIIILLINFQIVPTFNPNNQLQNTNQAPNELIFYHDLPANGFTTFFVEKINKDSIREPLIQHQVLPQSKSNVLTNGIIDINFDDYGFIKSIVNVAEGVETPFKQEFMYYEAHVNGTSDQTSGAYVFRPQFNFPDPISHFGTVNVIFTYLEARQIFADYASQIIRLFPGEERIEFEWTVGPLPIIMNVK